MECGSSILVGLWGDNGFQSIVLGYGRLMIAQIGWSENSLKYSHILCVMIRAKWSLLKVVWQEAASFYDVVVDFVKYLVDVAQIHSFHDHGRIWV
jgi:hypothetical protein